MKSSTKVTPLLRDRLEPKPGLLRLQHGYAVSAKLQSGGLPGHSTWLGLLSQWSRAPHFSGKEVVPRVAPAPVTPAAPPLSLLPLFSLGCQTRRLLTALPQKTALRRGEKTVRGSALSITHAERRGRQMAVRSGQLPETSEESQSQRAKVRERRQSSYRLGQAEFRWQQRLRR